MAVPLTRVLPLTMVVCLIAGLPAAIIAPHLQGAQTESSYLFVASGLLATAAGITGLVGWRLIGHALAGWLGVALIVWGVLALTESAMSGYSAGTRSGLLPLDHMVGAFAAGALLWRGLRDTEVNAGLSPLVALATAVGTGFVALIALRLVEALGTLSTALSGLPAQTAARTVASIAWFCLVLAAARRHRRAAASGWLPLFASFVCLGLALPTIDPRAAAAASALTFVGMAVALGGALVCVHELLQREERLQLKLRQDLDDTRQRASIDHAQLEEWMHDLRNAVAGLRAADAVLRAGGENDRAKHVVLSEAVTGELARLQALVLPTPSFRVAPVTLRSVLAPVVAAERALGAEIHLAAVTTTVQADSDALTRAVQNVLVNARTYGGNGRTIVRAHRRGPVVELSIWDGGPGISVDERLAVFERGHRGSSSAGTDGTGLGLFVARRMLEAMGGEIDVADDSPGCRMVLTLQAAADDLAQCGPLTERRAAAEVGNAQLRPAS